MHVLEGHSRTVWSLAVLPDGRLASGSWDGTVRVWELPSGHEAALYFCNAAVTALAAPSEGLIVAGDASGAVHFLRRV